MAGYRQTVLSAFQDVEDNLAALRILEEEATQQADAVAAAERLLALAMNRYQAGVTTYLEVITAREPRSPTSAARSTSSPRRMTASVNLVKALGGGWRAADLASGGAEIGSRPPEPRGRAVTSSSPVIPSVRARRVPGQGSGHEAGPQMEGK